MDLMVSLASAVARIEGRLQAQEEASDDEREHLRLTIKEAVQEALEPMTSRVAALEADVKAAKTIGALMAGAVGFLAPIASWLLPKLIHLVPFLVLLTSCAPLVGCASLDKSGTHIAETKWLARPVKLVASDAFSPECQEALVEALAFWREQGVDYLSPSVVPASDKRFDGHTHGGTITIVPNGEIGSGAAGETYHSTTITGAMYSADIHIVDPDWCKPQVLAHELGHALGLVDIYEEESSESLMYWLTSPGGYGLSPAELEHVR